MSERSRVRGRNLTKLRRQRQRQRELRKKIGWVGKKKPALSVHHAKFLCCTATMWNYQLLRWLKNGNGKAMNTYYIHLSQWTRTQSPSIPT